MRPIKYEDYKLDVLSRMVKVDKFLNKNAIGLTDAEAREKKLWTNKDKLPSEKAIREKFEELKPELQAEADKLDAADIDDENKESNDDLVKQYYAKDQDLGLTAKQCATFLIKRDYDSYAEAIRYLKANSKVKLDGVDTDDKAEA